LESRAQKEKQFACDLVAGRSQTWRGEVQGEETSLIDDGMSSMGVMDDGAGE
jgi:hypothetical protein